MKLKGRRYSEVLTHLNHWSLDDNIKRISQSKPRELKKFAIFLAKLLEQAKEEIDRLDTIINDSNQKEFNPEQRFKEQIFKSAAELYRVYPGKNRRIDSLKITIGQLLNLYYPYEQEFKLLLSWAKELKNIKSYHQGIIKDFQNYLDRSAISST